VWLTKQEAFAACQALADADRVLVALGEILEAGALGDLFELLEDRLTGPAPTGSRSGTGDASGHQPTQGATWRSGPGGECHSAWRSTNSSERELTQ
jgi:hypothetical protein